MADIFILYRRLTSNGDNSKKVNLKQARAMAANDLMGEADDDDDGCPNEMKQAADTAVDAIPVKPEDKVDLENKPTTPPKVKKRRVVKVPGPRFVVQKKKKKAKMEVVEKPSDIDEDTVEVHSGPEPRGGIA